MDFHWAQMVLVLLVGLFIFGPDKLPKAISDGLRFIRNVRTMASNATNDLGRELGADIKLEDLHPKTFIRKHVLSEDDQSMFRNQADSLRQQINDVMKEPLADPDPVSVPVQPSPTPDAPKRRRFDLDAT